jgi:hypothetical protein
MVDPAMAPRFEASIFQLLRNKAASLGSKNQGFVLRIHVELVMQRYKRNFGNGMKARALSQKK